VIRHIRVDTAQDAHVIDMFGRPGEQLADLDAAATIFLEAKRRAHGPRGLAFGAEVRVRQRFAVVLVEQRLGIKGVHVRWAAVHEKMSQAFRLRGKVRLSGSKRIGVSRSSPDRGRKEAVGPQYAGETKHAEAKAAATKQLAAREGERLQLEIRR